MFYGGNVVLVQLFFFTHFYFGGRQHFSFPLQNFHVVLQQKMSPLFFTSRSSSLLLFFSLSFAGLSVLLSLFLCLSLVLYSKFVVMTINLRSILQTIGIPEKVRIRFPSSLLYDTSTFPIIHIICTRILREHYFQPVLGRL